MNKTININLAGIIFHLDEDAFARLQEYLNKLKAYFASSEGRDEIIHDIEARFAELFQEKLSKSKEVITLTDVQDVIKIMGEPEAYMEDEEPVVEPSPAGRSQKKTSKRIFRDPDDQVMGGVCSGIAAYFGIDPLVIRLLFVIMFFGFGTGFILYLLLWVLIPEASSAAEKLQMRGETVNASNIGKVINEEVDNLKGKFQQSASDLEQKAKEKDFKGIFTSFFEFVGNAFAFLFRMVFKLLGFGMVIVGLCFAIALLATLFGAGPLLFDLHHFPFNIATMVDAIFLNSAQYTWAWIGLCIFIGIPILQLLYTGVRIIFTVPPAPRALRIGSGFFWILSIVMLFGVAVQIGLDFDRGAHHNRTVNIDEGTLPQDTLFLTIGEEQFETGYRRRDFDIQEASGTLYCNSLEMDVKRSPNNQASVRIKTSARGGSRAEAFDRAKNIEYQLVQSGNTLRFNDFFSFDKRDKWREQEVYITLYLPVGMTIYLDESMEQIIYDIKNVHNMWDGDMLGHYWIMLPEGLTCVDCTYYN